VSASRAALWGPFAAALVAVFCLSSLSSVPGAEYVWDKLLHAIGYAGVSALALRAFHGGFDRPRARPTLAALALMLAWFVSDEWHQSFVPGRDAQAMDVVADLVGFGVAVAALFAWSIARGGAARAPKRPGAL
jgi:VanZ family protein